ncbi:hypothetical protein [Pollutibacter soli]|uniref:hypothetical protein n=1 Tax=Pollutibacter soli TaxID=3034157 RepID=UPI00301399D8
MKRLFTTTLVAGLSLAFVLPSCVSSKKYKTSQSELATSRATVETLRSDSARLATESSNLQQKVSSLETTNSSMKTSLDSLNNYISQQKPNMDYQAYFTARQEAGTQMQQTLATDLSGAGLTSADIEHTNGTVSVSLDEKKFFSGGSTTLNSNGKKVVKQIASTVKSQADYKVGVMPATVGMPESSDASMDNNSSANNSNVSADANANHDATASSSTGTAKKSTAAKKSGKSYAAKKRYTSEGGRTVSNKAKPRKSTGASMAVRSQRAANVAKTLLTEGVEEVSVTLKKDTKTKSSGSQKDAIKVVISPDNSKMDQPKETAKN